MKPILRLVTGAALLLCASAASAQVASPVLPPGTANIIVGNPGFEADPSFLPLNPAVMSWNGGSVFGLGQTTRVERDVKTPSQSEEYSSAYGGFRWTGDTLAVGLETLSLSSDTSNVDFSFKTTAGGVSGKLADWFSLGGALVSSEIDKGSITETVKGWTVGGSAKFGDIFFAGVGTGRENLDHEETGDNYSDERSISQYGLALYTGGGKGGGNGVVWHLEYSVMDKDDFTDKAGTNFGGFTRTTGAIEMIWKSILLSYTSYTTEAKTGKATLDGTAIEAGWVSDKSFFITARIQKNTEKNDGDKVADSNSMSVNIGLQF
jgi:hypothetical protein